MQILTSKDGRLPRLQINRLEKQNALAIGMYQRMAAQIANENQPLPGAGSRARGRGGVQRLF